MKTQPTLVLIHGAGLNATDWRLVTPHLETASISVEFPHRGEDKSVAGLRLKDYSAAIMQQLNERTQEDVILVGHSIGGLVAMDIAPSLGDRLKGFVAVGSVLPNPNNSYSTSLPFPDRLIFSIIVRLLGTKPPEKVIKNSLCRGLDDGLANEVATHFTAESRHLFSDKVCTHLPDVKSLYVQLTNDTTVKPALQSEMAKRIKNGAVAKMATGHMPMLEQPKELATLLNGFVAKLTD